MYNMYKFGITSMRRMLLHSSQAGNLFVENIWPHYFKSSKQLPIKRPYSVSGTDGRCNQTTYSENIAKVLN